MCFIFLSNGFNIITVCYICTKRIYIIIFRAQVLYKIVYLLRQAFGGVFNEEAIRNHFILIYELLDGARYDMMLLFFFFFSSYFL